MGAENRAGFRTIQYSLGRCSVRAVEGRSRPQALGVECEGKREEAMKASISSRQSGGRGRGVLVGMGGWHFRAVVRGRKMERRWMMVVIDGIVSWLCVTWGFWGGDVCSYTFG